ncbi:MAG: glycine--tRNA ligase subunit beta [Pseudomonadales bacterium]
MRARDFLLEIGTEELPPKSLKRLMTNLVIGLEEALDQAQLSHEGIHGFATPRRLAVKVAALAAAQPEQQIERRGPAVTAAFDEAGKPSKAAIGFARSCGIDEPSALERMQTDKGEWLVFRDVQPGKPLSELIEAICTTAINSLPIERAMRWGSSRVQFVRPVHWIVMLHGDEVLPASLFGIEADRLSRGHRFMSSGTIKLKDANSYVESLRTAHVVVDFAERAQLIRAQLDKINQDENASVVIDPALLDEVTALVEWPVALCGRFDSAFLAVPEEALISAMKSHQRYFHLVDNSGRLLPRFITIANLESRDPELVIKGNERVIAPRLADAAFFYEQDSKTTLESKLARLQQVVFQSQLGSYRDKAERVSRLAAGIAESVGEDPSTAARAGLLCKADLVTDMVAEFPELQGLMGRYYAEKDGEPAAVATAIGEHYRPTQSGGELPDSKAGQYVAIADKLDTLTGLFGIGQPPTGSRDPFALRRQILGVIRICIECDVSLDIADTIEMAARLHGDTVDVDATRDALVGYLFERMAGAYHDQGIPTDTFNAIRFGYAPPRVLTTFDSQVKAVQDFRSHPQAEALVSANKRVANILKDSDAAGQTVSAGLFTEEAETRLYTELTKLQQELEHQPTFRERLLALANLQPVIDQYFDEVMVMAEDPAIRTNRLATLAAMRDLFLGVADVSVLQL